MTATCCRSSSTKDLLVWHLSVLLILITLSEKIVVVDDVVGYLVLADLVDGIDHVVNDLVDGTNDVVGDLVPVDCGCYR